METIQSYIDTHKEQLLNELFSLMRIPSISANPAHQPDMLRCAEQWCELLKAAGVDRAEILPTTANPVVFAQKIVDAAAPTIMVYGHYDVMPADPIELWHCEPFEPQLRDGIIWGRGADDDKGQSFIQYTAFRAALQHGILKCNVKFLLEGGEEVGSPGLEQFCAENKELLKSDIILVSDTSMVSEEIPSITTGLRGLAYWEIAVTGPNKDLHSGLFGGAVANPITELSKLIANIVDEKGHITIPHFYDTVTPVSPQERTMQQSVPHSDEEYAAEIGVKALFGEEGYTTLERTGMRPAFDVCGIWGGYTGEGAKTVLPSKAFAKVSCRLVPGQNHEEISTLFKEYIERVAPDTISVEVTPMHGGESYVCPIDLPAYKVVERAYTKAFGKAPLAVRRGGSIPIIAAFERVLGVKSILMGFGLESNAIHSPNENQSWAMIERGIRTVYAFYEEFGSDTHGE